MGVMKEFYESHGAEKSKIVGIKKRKVALEDGSKEYQIFPLYKKELLNNNTYLKNGKPEGA
jgi:hypothetical protein